MAVDLALSRLHPTGATPKKADETDETEAEMAETLKELAERHHVLVASDSVVHAAIAAELDTPEVAAFAERYLAFDTVPAQ